MTRECESSVSRVRRLNKGARLAFAMVLSLTISCGGVGKSKTELPSRKEYFLRRDTPVDSIRVAATEVAANASIPAGEVDGIVVDGYWGDPVSFVQILYRDAQHPEKIIAVVSKPTDTSG